MNRSLFDWIKLIYLVLPVYVAFTYANFKLLKNLLIHVNPIFVDPIIVLIAMILAFLHFTIMYENFRRF